MQRELGVASSRAIWPLRCEGYRARTGGSRLRGSLGIVFSRQAARTATATARVTVTVISTAADTTNPVVCVTHARVEMGREDRRTRWRTSIKNDSHGLRKH